MEKILACLHFNLRLGSELNTFITEPYFDSEEIINKVLSFEKKLKPHTIRADKSNRWKPGNKIHFVINNRTKDRFQFAPVVECKSVQKIVITHGFNGFRYESQVWIDSHLFAEYGCSRKDINWNEKGLLKLAQNDGFDSIDAFFDYFDKDFIGKIIHWTDLKY
ncbi:MAG TPA: hypothetical protein PK643_00405 [Saprospiraceae bacterium]|nr:hypothetical protein [Saprospiraceae bacterium]